MNLKPRSEQSQRLRDLRAALDRYASVLHAHERELPSSTSEGVPVAAWHAALEETAQEVDMAFIRWRETRELRH